MPSRKPASDLRPISSPIKSRSPSWIHPIKLPSYQAMLIDEIKQKKQQLTNEHHHHNQLKSDISALIHNRIIIIRTNRLINNFIAQHQQNWSTIHYRKLELLRQRQNLSLPPPTNITPYVIEPIKNFSNRSLTNDEYEALSNGLDYVQHTTKYDQKTFISNMECLFVNLLGHCTDKHDYEEIDSNKPIEYKMTPQQLQYASKMRSICENFKSKSQKPPSKHQATKLKARKILKSLSKDKTIYITRPDKGRGVVIMNRTDYINKMNTIVNDPSTFKQIHDDPTIKQEDKLNRKLRQLKQSGFITEEEYQYCRPTGSQPARIYGLPKVHKDGLPLRPILSASGTFNYKLAKLLVRRLSHLRKYPTIITDTFSFADQLRKININLKKHRLISFDVVNLFTNIPLQETINNILAELYGASCECPLKTTRQRVNNSIRCKTCQNRINMKWLLEIATTETHFHFNGKIYLQINGVAMGSPLAPLLADIFLIHLEKQVMNDLKDNGLVYWRRYVDDSFAIIQDTADIEKLKHILNRVHPTIQFTHEEKEHLLPFLDINITRTPNNKEHEQLSMTVYRKPTYTGLMLKWSSFVPQHYKKNALSSMIYRAIRICTSYTLLHKELMFIKQVATANGYPLNYIEHKIRMTLNRWHQQGKTKLAQHLTTDTSHTNDPRSSEMKDEKTKKQVLLVDIPYVGKPTKMLEKRLINLAAQIKPQVNLQPIPRPPPSIQTLFPRKCPVPKHLQSGIVYEIRCNNCNASYIGKTKRQAIRRIEEHRGRDQLLRDSPSSTTIDNVQQLETPANTIRRSDRNKNKTVKYYLNKTPKPEEPKTQSALYTHQTTTNHTINWQQWKIIEKDSRPYQLLVKESLAIKQWQPELNKTISSAPLTIYPEGLPKWKPKVKMKQSTRNHGEDISFLS